MQQFLDQMVASPYGAFLLLFLAAFLEVFGDSYFHSGLHPASGGARLLPILIGVGLLAVYGLLINTPRWEFGKLIGVYVAVFFLTAQLVAKIRFSESPSRPILLGGSLIVGGGLIIAFWKH
ncbi:MAG TPA: hypothetical protein VGD59_14610 [Acidisarcina sp.]